MLNKGITLSLVAFVAILVLCPGTASAGTVTGTLQLNSGLDGSVTVTGTNVTWIPTVGSNGGLVAIGNTSTGTFSTYGGSNGVMLNLSTLNTPVSQNLPANQWTTDFLTVPGTTLGGASVIFNLTYVAGANTDLGASLCSTTLVSPLTSCTLATNSPFLLTQLTSTQTLVSMEVFATAWAWNGTATTGTPSQYVGTYSTQIPYAIAPLSGPSTLESILAGPNGTLNGTWSATFTPIPEPGTLQLGLGAALLLAGGLARRRRSQK
jgi:hypothetical protein